MKVRIRFSKTGALVYIGHLDVMRYFQKLFRRAGIPVAYSEGFSPHQILSFSNPLPLGMESYGEYADVELTESIPTEDAVLALKEKSVGEIGIMSFKALPEKCENAMASVRASGYNVSTCGIISPEEAKDAVDAFLAKEEVYILKKTKKSENMIDIRNLVHRLEADEEGIIHMLISSGSTDNLKPHHVLTALCGREINDRGLLCVRTDQYTYSEEGKLISLDEIGTDIT